MKEENVRIETELEVKAYIQNLQYTLKNGAKISFQVNRYVDENRDPRYTNQYTVEHLFPKENYLEALKRELVTLTPQNYIKTVKDIRFPFRSEMREFGKTYKGFGDVYIKIRVELLGMYGESTIFVMSFHYAERPFSEDLFPYSNK